MKICKPFRYVLAALTITAGFTASAAEQTPEDNIPVAPISAISYRGSTNAFRLANESFEVVILPETGRMISMGFIGQDSPLNVNDYHLDRLGEAPENDDWINYGGDWLWPVAQSHWTKFQGGEWPPSRLIGGRPWSGRAWKNGNNGSCCMLSQEYGSPLNLKVTRRICLDPEKPIVTMLQRAEATDDSEIPVTLWNISQISKAHRVVMATREDSAFPNGFKVMMGDDSASDGITECDDAIVYKTISGEYKLGSDAGAAWIAAQRGSLLVIEQAVGSDRADEFPDGGCTIEMYSNKGLGYSEIETLSEEKVLEKDESIENTLTISFHRIDAGLSDCELAAKVQELLSGK